MNCYLHPETPASAFCRTCGRALCPLCQRLADGTVYCQDHVPVPFSEAAQPGNMNASNPYAQPQGVPHRAVPVQTSPALAFILGWIPGVGAIYNGQYIKGLVHAVIFGVIVSLISGNDERATTPFLGIMLAAFVFYMPFEAYHTAKKQQLGIAVDEWSSLISPDRAGSRTPTGPIILIGIGFLFLLDTLNLLDFHRIGRYWPVLLIVIGAYMLYSRANAARIPPYPPPPAGNGPVGGTTAGSAEVTREQ
ncbi:MAG: LiaI-LiaF-like domain-containing protein [Bryobacteraceae bacterium]